MLIQKVRAVDQKRILYLLLVVDENWVGDYP